MTDLARFCCSATGVVAQLGTDNFFDALLSFVRDWVDVDEACVLLYPRGGGPAIAYREHPRCSVDSTGRRNTLVEPACRCIKV